MTSTTNTKALESKGEWVRRRMDSFASLPRGNTGHAKEFLEKFGPLQLPRGTRIYGRGFHITIDLAKFWAMQLRFCLIAELWENLSDKDRLTQAIAKVSEKRELASQFQAVSLGTEFSPPPEDESRRYLFPWERLKLSGDEWLKHASMKDLRDCALYLVNIELNAHMFGRRIVWHRGFEPLAEVQTSNLG